MSLSITEKEDLFRYIDASFDSNPDAKFYSLIALNCKIYLLICEFCRDNDIWIILPDIDKLGLEYLTEYINKKEGKRWKQ